MDRILGILGGMGPLATVDLFKKITIMTESQCDQEHIHVVIDSNAQIPDRTAFLVREGVDPTNYLIKSAMMLEKAGAECLVMPCNTAHYFYDEIVKNINIPFLNIFEETARELKRNYTGIKCAGLLATDGTVKTGIYENFFSEYGIKVLVPDYEHQQYVSEVIYNVKKGIYDFDLSKFRETLSIMKENKSDIFILGCSEIPIAFDVFNLCENIIDPTTVIAKAAIKFLGYNIKTLP
jgi:aspartate racemase